MKKFIIILKHEFKVFAMNKTFIVLTILGPFFLFAISILPSILTTNITKVVTLVVSGDPVNIVDLVTASLKQTSIKVLNEDQFIELLNSNKKYRDNKNIQEKIDIARNKNDRNAMVSLFDFATSSKIIDGYLYLNADVMQSNKAELVLKDVADFTTVGTVQYVLQQVLSSLRLVENGMDPGLVQKLVVQPEIIVKQISEKGKIKQDFLTVLMTGIGFSLLVYMTILLYGQSIGRAVLTEKTSKTIEVLLSSTKPLNILYGKIFGQGVAALLQYFIWISMGLVFLKFIGPLVNVNFSLPFQIEYLAYLIIFFLLGFFLYAALYSIAGAASDDQQNLDQLAWPFIIFLIIPLVMISPIVTNSSSPLVVAMSLFPMTSPIVMFVRIISSTVSISEIILSISLLLVFIIISMLIASRIFPIGILMSGRKFSFKDIKTWLKG